MALQDQRVRALALEGGKEAQSGPQQGSCASVEGGLCRQTDIEFPQIPSAKLDGEQGRSRWPDYSGMRHAHGIEHSGERPEFIQFAAITFEIVSMKHNRYVSKFMLMSRHGARNWLAKFREHYLVSA
jgi:hypothetical protein